MTLTAFLQIRYDSSGKNLWNPCMHLCNYSINKYHSDYIKCDDPDQEDQGHKWSLSALLRHLKANGIDTSQLMGSIEDVIIKVFFENYSGFPGTLFFIFYYSDSAGTAKKVSL